MARNFGAFPQTKKGSQNSTNHHDRPNWNSWNNNNGKRFMTQAEKDREAAEEKLLQQYSYDYEKTYSDYMDNRRSFADWQSYDSGAAGSAAGSQERSYIDRDAVFRNFNKRNHSRTSQIQRPVRMFVPLKKEEEKPLPRLDSDEDYPTLAQSYLSSNQISTSSVVPNETSAATATAAADSDSKPLLAFNVAAVQSNNHEFVKSIELVKKEQSVPKTVRRFKKSRRISFAEFEESLLTEASDSQYDDDFLNPESDFNYTAFSDEYDMKKSKLR